MNKIEVYGSRTEKVYVNSIDVLEEIHIIDRGDWIIEKDGKYIQMAERTAGRHSFDHEVRKVSKETYDLYRAKELLINFLKRNNE